MIKSFFHKKLNLSLLAGCVLALIPMCNVFAGGPEDGNSSSSGQTSQPLQTQSAHADSIQTYDYNALVLNAPSGLNFNTTADKQPMVICYAKPRKLLRTERIKKRTVLANCTPRELYFRDLIHEICDSTGSSWRKEDIISEIDHVLNSMGAGPLSRAEKRNQVLMYNRIAKYGNEFLNLFSKHRCDIALAQARAEMKAPVQIPIPAQTGVSEPLQDQVHKQVLVSVLAEVLSQSQA